MTKEEFNKKQREKYHELLLGPDPSNQFEKDVLNLKMARYSIMFGSRDYRSGLIASLDRAIEALERTTKIINEMK